LPTRGLVEAEPRDRSTASSRHHTRP
jgi:hypothetical protein